MNCAWCDAELASDGTLRVSLHDQAINFLLSVGQLFHIINLAHACLQRFRLSVVGRVRLALVCHAEYSLAQLTLENVRSLADLTAQRTAAFRTTVHGLFLGSGRLGHGLPPPVHGSAGGCHGGNPGYTLRLLRAPCSMIWHDLQ